ncbi:hypothetical protein SK128_007231 [Halocaridina rubra]|uniref:Sulfotransferase domain-containing protein n=1 Tax=Halocaridina rubra TaxID=373956 RepID=A0AAN9AHK9_HALRR
MKRKKIRVRMSQTMARVVISVTLLAYFVLAAKYTPVFYMALRNNRPANIIPRSVLETVEHSQNDTEIPMMQLKPRPGPKSMRNELSVPMEEAVMKIVEELPKVVVLWTTWRSGSNYLGELLANAKTNTFYSNEPLHYWKVNFLYEDNTETLFARNYLHDLLRCHLDQEYQQQLNYMSRQKYYMKWNGYLFKQCKKKMSCADSAFINEVCKQADLHLAKVLRLSLKWVRPLLQDERLDLRVIYVVRDPRAVLLSRERVDWCQTLSCSNPVMVCELLQEDLKQIQSLSKNFPDKFKFLQYENITTDPEGSLRDMMAFLDLPVSESQMRLLRPTSVSPDSLYSTRKDAKTQSERWRTISDYQNMLYYQRSCEGPIKTLGLRMFSSEEEFRNLSESLVLPLGSVSNNLS